MYRTGYDQKWPNYSPKNLNEGVGDVCGFLFYIYRINGYTMVAHTVLAITSKYYFFTDKKKILKTKMAHTPYPPPPSCLWQAEVLEGTSGS
jgi:hypothetical protein